MFDRGPDLRQWLEAARTRQTFLVEQAKLLRQQGEEYQGEAARLRGVLERTRAELVGHLLPDLDDEALGALEARLRYHGGLLPIKRRVEQQLAASEAERLALEATDDAQNLDFHRSRAADELAELAPSFRTLDAELRLWQQLPHYRALQQRGWFSPGYRPSGWLRRLADWRSVSLLMAQLERQAGKARYASPDALLADHERLLREHGPLAEAHADLTARGQQLEQLATHLAELRSAPARLMEQLHQALGEALLGHFEACDEALRTELAVGDPDLAAYLTKERGLTKQIQYLDELKTTRIEAPLQALQQQTSRLGEKIAKMDAKRRRGKRVAVSADELARLQDLQPERWQKRQQNLSALRGRIGGFSAYDRGSFVTDYLWWDLLTHGARADDLYEVRVFHEQHPDWDWRSYEPTFSSAYGGGHQHGGHDHSASAYDAAAGGLAGEMGERGDGLGLADAS